MQEKFFYFVTTKKNQKLNPLLMRVSLSKMAILGQNRTLDCGSWANAFLRRLRTLLQDDSCFPRIFIPGKFIQVFLKAVFQLNEGDKPPTG